MAEKEVAVKITAKNDGVAGKQFADVAKAAKDASQWVDKYAQGIERASKASERLHVREKMNQPLYEQANKVGGQAPQTFASAFGSQRGFSNIATELSSVLQIFHKIAQAGEVVAAVFKGIKDGGRAGGLASGLEAAQENFGGGSLMRSAFLGASRWASGTDDPTGVYEHGSVLNRAYMGEKAAESIALNQTADVSRQGQRMQINALDERRRQYGGAQDELGVQQRGVFSQYERERFQDTETARQRAGEVGGLGELEYVQADLRRGHIKTPDQLMADAKIVGELDRGSRDVTEKKKALDEASKVRPGQDAGVRAGDIADAAQAYTESLNRMLASEQKHLELIRQQSAERLDGLRQALDKTQAIIDAEKGKLKSGQQEYGRLDPIQREIANQLAQRFKTGENLQSDELDKARKFGFFSEKVAEQDFRAGAAFKENIQTVAGLDRNLKAAEAVKVEVQNKIQAEIKINEVALAEQLEKNIIPLIIKAVAAGAQEATAKVNKALLDMSNARAVGAK